MALDFLPFKSGQTITAEDLNALVGAIQDGSIFAPGNVVGDLIGPLGDRVTALEFQVSNLAHVQATQNQHEQIPLTALQSVINLEKTPTIDGELVFLNGMALYKNDLIPAAVHDYTISGKVITLDPALAAQIVDGDLLLVAYEYVVGA